jgi:drug/metabolite transporter (DMT)-like permease
LAFFALGTSFCIALATLISAEVVKAVGGPMALSRWRMLIGFLMLALIATAVGGWGSLTTGYLPLIVLSSLVAIVVADPALNAGIALIGARRTGLIFSLSAPFAAGLGFLVLGETLGPSQLVGCALVAAGIAFAVRQRLTPDRIGMHPSMPRSGCRPRACSWPCSPLSAKRWASSPCGR